MALTQQVRDKISLLKEDRMEATYLVQDQDAIVALITYPRVRITQRVQDDAVLSSVSLSELWDGFSVDFSMWSQLSGIKLFALRKIFMRLSLNGIIYPDNSVANTIHQLIRGRAFVDQFKTISEATKFQEAEKRRIEALKKESKHDTDNQAA